MCFWKGTRLYISLPDGSDPNAEGNNFVLRFTKRLEDPNGELLARIGKNDLLTFYGGSSKPYRYKLVDTIKYGWYAGYKDHLSGYGWWAYAHGWHPTERIVFESDNSEPIRTPAWWGLKLGNQDGDLLVMLKGILHRLQGQKFTGRRKRILYQARKAIRTAIGHDNHCIIPVGDIHYSSMIGEFPTAQRVEQYRNARQLLLRSLAEIQKNFPEQLWAPRLVWGKFEIPPATAPNMIMRKESPRKLRHLLSLAMCGVKLKRTSSLTIVEFTSLPDNSLLRRYGLNRKSLAIGNNYPPAGHYIFAEGKLDGRPCLLIIGRDAEGAERGILHCSKFWRPTWD